MLTVDLPALVLGFLYLVTLQVALDVKEDRSAEQQVREKQHQQDQPLLLGHSRIAADVNYSVGSSWRQDTSGG